jgi:hypothetical protein
MIITDEKKIRDIQEEFQRKFPNLKLEFYKKGHESGEGSPDKEKISPENTISQVRTVHKEGDLSIDGHQKVSTLESNFADLYGLNVQVFRRSKGIWLQTITTDHWTLTEQDRKGAESH